jgi:hypothetical protein
MNFKATTLLLLVPMLACGDSETDRSSPAAPSLAAPSSRTFTLSGQVITSQTRVPIPDATVSVLDSALNGADAGKTTTTDRSGHFSFTEMQQSTVYVKVSAVEYFPNNTPLRTNELRTINLVPLGPVIQPSGQVIDAATSAPIGGATVDINGRYRTTTDAFGKYSLTGRLDIGESSIITSYADGYESHTRYLQGNAAQSFRLRRIERISDGQSWPVTVRPDDSQCYNNFQDPSFGLPGSGFLCRTVRVVAQTDGMLTIEAVSTEGGSRPTLELEVLAPWFCCIEEMDNPISIRVRTGTEVQVNVGMPERSPTARSFIVRTSMSP